ncbi:MAG TPA: hypothetical protein VNF47_15100 [Streptosporangiaceae bacterium]|nr:hypothetical protein [Streptosporangiaceae bacterium]
MPTQLVTGDAAVRAVLADPSYLVPPAPAVPDSETGTLGWLRASVPRFCNGPAHARRRAQAERDIAGLDPARLGQAAFAATTAELSSAGTRLAGFRVGQIPQAGPEQFDAMVLARRIPVAVLAAELGFTATAEAARIVTAVIAVAAGYPNPDLARGDTDASVAFLLQALGSADPQESANKIGLLVQTCDATAGLIGNALARALGTGAEDRNAGDAVEQTLRADPPVLRTRRVSPAGDVVAVDISEFPFGTGSRPCPGADLAQALAAGVVEAISALCDLADTEIDYPGSENLRVPARLLVARR